MASEVIQPNLTPALSQQQPKAAPPFHSKQAVPLERDAQCTSSQEQTPAVLEGNSSFLITQNSSQLPLEPHLTK